MFYVCRTVFYLIKLIFEVRLGLGGDGMMRGVGGCLKIKAQSKENQSNH